MDHSNDQKSHDLSQRLRRKVGSRLPFVEQLAASQTESRVYRRLSTSRHEIRVISIEPGAYDDDVRASLIVTQVHRKSRNQSLQSLWRAKKDVPYEAISYCWGDPQHRAEVRLNNRTISAPASAVDALRRFRLQDGTRLVWLDALSINQDDLDERSSQVAMMGDIYAYAVQTLVYLEIELEDNKLQRTLALLHQICDDYVGEEGPDWATACLTQDGGTEIVMARAHQVVIKDEEYLALLNVIFENRWFGRLWVWQEVLLASNCTVHIKGLSIPWKTIVAVTIWASQARFGFPRVNEPQIPAAWLPSYTSRMHMTWPAIIHMTGLLTDGKTSSANILEFLLSTSASSQTTDPRDRIYAILGLTATSKDGTFASIQPDYRKSTRDCMRDATRAIIGQTGRLNVLNDCRLGVDLQQYSEGELWPSWVPVWCRDGSDFTVHELGADMYVAHNGCALDKALASDAQDVNTLLVRGFVVDTVTDVLWPTEQTFASVPSLANFLTQVNCVRQPRQPPISLSGLVLILMVESMRNVFGRVDRSDERISRFDEYTDDLDQNDPYGADIMMSTTYTLERLIFNCRAKALFCTRAGRIGLGPASMAVDDTLCILFGGCWPFVMRSMGHHHQMVGPCYTKGIMDGEAVVECEERGDTPVVFQLR